MSSFNKVIMMGHLTRDPVLSYTPGGTPVVEFGMATNHKWTPPDGEAREEVCFIDCRAFGRMAENIAKYCQKGRPLLVEGRLTFDQWESKDGSKRSKHRVTVGTFTFVDSKGGEKPSAPSTRTDVADGPADDDIPF